MGNFDNNLELYIEQNGFAASNTVYYDAVGLRVTRTSSSSGIFNTTPSAFMSTVKGDQLSLNGSGVTVAVIDSGVNYHEDFTTTNWNWRILESMNFTSGNSDDEYGHGTHVAGIIAGNGTKSNGIYKGVAPGVNLISLKVANKDGMTYESDVVDAIQWVYTTRRYNIRIVNLSLNSTVAQSYHTSPLARRSRSCGSTGLWWWSRLETTARRGPVTLYPPANDPFVITVGATEDKGTASLAMTTWPSSPLTAPPMMVLSNPTWSLLDATLLPRWAAA